MTSNQMRGRLVESTKGLWGTLNPLTGHLYESFGRGKAQSMGGVYYDLEAFIATINVYKGDTYNYVYNTFKSDIKPRKFQRFNGGVKITEEQLLQKSDNESLRSMIEVAARKQAIGVRTAVEQAIYGHNTVDALVSVLHRQATGGSDINNPADCNPTPGTAMDLTAVKWSGASKTERNIETAIGWAVRQIGLKTIDGTTGESILKDDGSNYFDLYLHPNFARILETNHDILDTGETDPLPYAKRMKQDWNITLRPSIQFDDGGVATTNTQRAVLTANTKETFKLVEVEAPTWTAWKEIDDGEVVCGVKRYRTGIGAVAVPFLAGTQAYKAMVCFNSTPYNA